MKKLTLFLAAVVINAAGLVTALPTGAAGTNLITNPSVETAAGTMPANWASSKSGTNTTSFNYLNTAHTGSRSLNVNMTKRSSGNARWYFTPVNVAPNTTYTFSDWYQSNVTTRVQASVTNVNGSISNLAAVDVPASTNWKQNTLTITTPANAKTMTVYHLINKVGQLTTDDFSLEGPAVVAPNVALSSPASGSTVAGTQTVTATASGGSSPIKNVQFKLDGVNLGSADTTTPYSVSWNTKNSTNGSHTLTAVVTNTSNLTAESAPMVVTVNNVATAPTVTVTAPAAGSTLSGSLALSANASDAVSVAGVQFKIDNANVGSEDTTAPYSINWDSKTVANGTHSVSAVARNNSGLTTTSVPVSINVQNTVVPTPPTVTITGPANGSTLAGTQTVTASASDAQGIKSVQFKLDGVNVGTADTIAPYETAWNTVNSTNGSHTLTAVATNTANLTATAANVTVTVSNVMPPPPAATNLIPNPSLETANGSVPASWLSSNWGANTSVFSYLSTGHTGSRSVKVETTSYTDGAANWYYADVPATAGKSYKYENWYQSNVDTEVDAQVTMTDGSVQYYWLGTVLANTSWTKFNATFTAPAGTKSIAIYQILAKKGYIVSDDYSLSEYTPTPFNRGLVSITFDDGWANQYANALPVLNSLGIKSTFYIISGEIGDAPDYMTLSQIQSLQNAGMEIASHSVTHSDMTTLSQAAMTNEFSQSKATLQNALGVTINNFAYPYGAYNATTINVGKQYYRSQRSVVGGLNTKDTFDITTLKIYEVDSNISQAQVQGWINAAIDQKAWLILVYHEIANSPVDPSDELYTTKPADFTAEMNYLKNSGVQVVTVNQALDELVPQL